MNTNRSIKIAVTVAALMGMIAGAKAGPLGESCSARLNALSAEWNAFSFQPPSKPNAARVVGRNGHETTGGQFNFIRGQIRLAVQACEAGRGYLAEQQIDYARTLLARTAGYDTAPTGAIR